MDEDLKFMQEALALAREAAAEGEVPVGCVVVRDGEIRPRSRRSGGHCRCLPEFGRLAAVGMYAVCDLGALPYVCRCDYQRPDSPGGFRGIG